mgnify:CR=1 FL=1
MTIELQGFQTQTTNVAVASGDRARVDAKLQLGTVSESIQVTAEAALLQTDTSTVGALFTDKAVQDLPVAGRKRRPAGADDPGRQRRAGQLAGQRHAPHDDRRQTSSVSINGTADTQNNQLLDGMDNNERAIGTVGVKPSIDAIAEVKVQTNLYSAETGRTLGGVINILTKSGSNEFHGTAYDYVRNDRFDSRSYFAATKPKLSQNQFGGSIGGPIRSDRTFFFVDYEGLRSTQGVANLITVPTARMRRRGFLRTVRWNLRSDRPAENAVCRQRHSREQARLDRAPSHPALSAAERTGTGQQLLERDGSHPGSRYDGFSYRSPFQRQQHAVCPLLL